MNQNQNQKNFVVISKLNNLAKIVCAIDKDHARNKAMQLIWGVEHKAKDFKVKTA